jgi:5'-deoxynucleotidase YfbR-like HD superfamily hydrolase
MTTQFKTQEEAFRYDWASHVPGHHEIELYSGRYLDLSNPSGLVIGLDDVAHGLAYTCRYSGQCADYYSVAQHAVMCARKLEKDGCTVLEQLGALHHDDAEAFLGDVVRPLKSLIQPEYGRLTDLMDQAITDAFGNLWPADLLSVPVVKAADNWALMVEAWRLLPSQGKQWGGQAHNWDVDMEAGGRQDEGLWRGYQSPRTAARSFIRLHNALVRAL